MIQQNKKRKHETSPSDDHNASDNSLLLFSQMQAVNSNLISLANSVKLADHDYFFNNTEVVDEFIANIHQFLEELNRHRRKVSFDKLNADILSHIYEFLDTKELMESCGLVSKLWRESLHGLKVKVKDETHFDDLLNSSYIEKVTSLRMGKSVELFKSLASCRNLYSLKILEFPNGFNSFEYLKKFHMPSLTGLYFRGIHEKEAIELFNSEFMSTIKELRFFVDTNLELISHSKYLDQITHLQIRNVGLQKGVRIDVLLKDKVKLEKLELRHFQLTLFPNLFTQGGYFNLITLDISNCTIRNQDLVNLMVSPNLPKLTTLAASNINLWETRERDETIAQFPPNSLSSITYLNIEFIRLDLFPSILDHCPKLKNLFINPIQESKEPLLKMMKSPSLSNLELLRIHCWKEVMTVLFTNPIFSNLRILQIFPRDDHYFTAELISKCTTLVKLTELRIGNMFSAKEITKCEMELKRNSTFSNLKHVRLVFGEETTEEGEY